MPSRFRRAECHERQSALGPTVEIVSESILSVPRAGTATLVFKIAYPDLLGIL
jgi:hypothetical protein